MTGSRSTFGTDRSWTASSARGVTLVKPREGVTGRDQTVLGGVGRQGRFGDVGVDGDARMRLREVQAADRAVLETWWVARLAVTETAGSR